MQSLSLGVPKGPFSFAKENDPFVPFPCGVQGKHAPRAAGMLYLLLALHQFLVLFRDLFPNIFDLAASFLLRVEDEVLRAEFEKQHERLSHHAAGLAVEVFIGLEHRCGAFELFLGELAERFCARGGEDAVQRVGQRFALLGVERIGPGRERFIDELSLGEKSSRWTNCVPSTCQENPSCW